ILRKAIQYCPTDNVYVVIDGADVFGDLREDFIGRILRLKDIPDKKVKIFLSSRNVPYISNSLLEPKTIDLDTNGFAKGDVKRFIELGVNKFGGWDTGQKNRAIETLWAKSEGIFLWASLAIENLKRHSTAPDYEEFLGKFPSELKGVF
ncbi:hypothetical protein HOY82DRAFT_453354, partial [Tuber indicum]